MDTRLHPGAPAEVRRNMADDGADLTFPGWVSLRLIAKKDSWRLYRYLRSDKEIALKQTRKGILSIDVGADISTMHSMSDEWKKIMTSLTFNLFFVFGCLLFYLPALWAKFSFSGENYTQATSMSAVIYSIFFNYLHWRFIDKGALPFLGVYEREPMGWLSLFMILAHAYALPTEGDIWFWSKIKKE